jgi:hypothetical protein
VGLELAAEQRLGIGGLAGTGGGRDPAGRGMEAPVRGNEPLELRRRSEAGATFARQPPAELAARILGESWSSRAARRA